MLDVIIENGRSRIEGDFAANYELSKPYNDKLREALGYMVKGVEWSPKFKERVWDGIISTYKGGKEKSFPTGLTPKVIEILDQWKEEGKLDYRIINKRIKLEKNADISVAFADYDRQLFDYQKVVVEKAKKHSRGIISLSMGGGKTMLSCQIISDISVVPTVFIVPSISLLRQTKLEFEKYLKIDGKPAKIGQAGGGICDINYDGVNVVTYQTAMMSFNEVFLEKTDKRGKAKTVAYDEHAGDKVKKTVPELLSDIEQAKSELKIAQKIAKNQLNDFDDAIRGLQSELEQFKSDNNAKRVISTEKKIEQKIKSKEFKLKSITKKEQEKLTKAEHDLDIKEKSIERKTKVRKLIEDCGVLFVDEAHLASVIIERLGEYANKAYYRIALSGTPFREDNQEIRIQGSFGKKIVEIGASDLIEMGRLVPPTINIVKINYHYPKREIEDYFDVYRNCIIDCWERNFRIKQFAEEFKKDGRPVLILVDRIEHGQILESMIKDSVFVPGSDEGDTDPGDEEFDYRKRMLNDCEANKNILIATSWAYTGIDAPAISVLILAGSAKSAVTTYQQIGRVLRRSDETGKFEAIVIDFNHTHPEFHKHFLTRVKVYRNERAFKVKYYKTAEKELND